MSSALLLVGLLTTFATANIFTFAPESAQLIWDPSYPLTYNFTELQLEDSASYWTSSFLTASNNRQYLVISHFIVGAFVRSSALDITTNKYWNNITGLSIADSTYSGQINIKTDTSSWLSTSADALTNQQISMKTPDYHYDLAFTVSSKPLLNVGGNAWNFGNGTSTEVSFPACRTTGNLNLNGTTLTIDPDNSLTWYDRQTGTGPGPSGNWTWFELHLCNNIKISAWAIDSSVPANTKLRFATVRVGDWQIVMNTTLTSYFDSSTWTSPSTNVTYPQHWNVNFGNGNYLDIRSTRDDQEMPGTAVPSYEGFAVATGNFMGCNKAWGLVEMVKAVNGVQ